MSFLRIISPALMLSAMLATPVFAEPIQLNFGHVGKAEIDSLTAAGDVIEPN